jgi:hypothetical protein
VATPTLVQHIASPCTDSMTATNTTLTVPLITPSVAGNLLMLVIFTTSGSLQIINSVTDDQSQTWSKDVTFETGTNANGYVFTMPNTAAGVTKLTVNFSRSDDTNITYTLSEWFNVAATTPIRLSWTHEGTAASTSWASGSSQTPTSGDLIYQCAAVPGGGYNTTSVFTAAASFSLECADLTDAGIVAQSMISAGAAVNPTITAGLSSTYLSFAVALKSAAQGADNASAFRIKRAQWINTLLAQSTYKYQLPTDGNLQVLVESNISVTVTSVTSSSAAYAHTTHSPQSNSSIFLSHLYSANSTPSRTNNGTITLSGTPPTGSGAGVLLDIIGANTAPFDTDAGDVGTQSVAGNLTTHTVTPAGAGELLIDYIDHDSGNETGVTDAAMTFVEPLYNTQDGTAGAHWTFDSGIAWKNTGSAATFTYTRSASAANNWAAIAAAYKAPAVGGDTLFAQSIF